MKIFEMYTGDGEGENITLYFETEVEALMAGKDQTVNDSVTGCEF